MENEPNLKPLRQGEYQALKQNTRYKTSLAMTFSRWCVHGLVDRASPDWETG